MRRQIFLLYRSAEFLNFCSLGVAREIFLRQWWCQIYFGIGEGVERCFNIHRMEQHFDAHCVVKSVWKRVGFACQCELDRILTLWWKLVNELKCVVLVKKSHTHFNLTSMIYICVVPLSTKQYNLSESLFISGYLSLEAMVSLICWTVLFTDLIYYRDACSCFTWQSYETL